MELLAYSLNDNPFGKCGVKVLNLSRNKIMKEGAKTLAQAIENNQSLEVLDLSQCDLGVSGTQVIAQALTKNTTLRHINLYRNKVDVDGARALRDMLKVNKTLEFLDVGYNRLREKGIIALTDGIISNPESNIRHLGIRFNFIRDDGFAYLFDNTIFSPGKSKIVNIYCLQNYLTEHYTLQLGAKVEQLGAKIYVDAFEKLQYLSQERLDRSIWISPLTSGQVQGGVEQIWKFFQ